MTPGFPSQLSALRRFLVAQAIVHTPFGVYERGDVITQEMLGEEAAFLIGTGAIVEDDYLLGDLLASIRTSE